MDIFMSMQSKISDFDVIVVGGGHAGIEAAYAAARMGSRTLMVTLDIEKIGLMPCNPAIGGIGKGHIVYEISALGGLMPKLCTQTYLQARMLNTRRGPAVQGLRLQIDKYAYNQLSRQILAKTSNLTLVNGVVDEIIVDQQTRQVSGVVLVDRSTYHAPTVVITTGTFLNGKVHVGLESHAAGRRDEQAVTGLSLFLQRNTIRMGRLKTGTPPRLLTSSVDFTRMEYQEPDNLERLFEFYPHKAVHKRACYITHTNAKTHEIIKNNLHLSAMYSGNIRGIGPRYCPSIEDKVGRFPDKTSHHIFVEPEGEDVEELYPNGISTSLPLEVQYEYVRSIVGFEQAVITKAGYAVEYDFVHPDQLLQTLELKTVPGLFLAGQINGTTGYEEAAGQGLVAGINAHLKAQSKEPFILDRTQSYIGVMIEDLVSMGVDEPYRMFTSRAEHRLALRQDNAFLRLSDRAYALGLLDEETYADFKREQEIINDTLCDLRAAYTHPELLKLFGEFECNGLALRAAAKTPLSDHALKAIYAEIRYAPYLKREQLEIEKTKKFQLLEMPQDMDYTTIAGLSTELQQKLTRHTPRTIAQAALIPGMTPAAISLLIFKIREHLGLLKHR